MDNKNRWAKTGWVFIGSGLFLLIFDFIEFDPISYILLVIGIAFIVIGILFLVLPSAARDKIGCVIIAVALAFCLFVAIGGAITILTFKPNNDYEPTSGEVMQWFDAKDSSGNYTNRGDEYNTKRSY